MKFFCVILFTIALVMAVALAKNNENSVDMKLMSFLSRSSNSLQQNPQRSVECFDYYVPLLNSIGEEYKRGYEECLSIAEDDITAAEEETAPQRKKLAQDSAVACAAVSACSGDNDESSAESIFQCYVKSSSESSRTLHGVSTQATVQLATLQENIRRIKSDEGACVTQNKIEYEQKSTATYDDFNDCILGISEVPTDTTEGPGEPESTVDPETSENTHDPETSENTNDPETTKNTDDPETSGNTDDPETDETTQDPESDEIMPEEDISRFIKNFRNFRKLRAHTKF